MKKGEDLHAGHRERLYNKFLANADAFSDHELLELMLFYFIPRKNTNEIAHRLLRAFGSLDKVFSAKVEELKSVDGIGEKTACAIALNGKFLNAIKGREQIKPLMSNAGSVKEVLVKHFKGEPFETFILYLLDRRYKVITSIEFCDKEREKVSADIPEIAKAFALHKPSFAIIAHNHPGGDVEPSHMDDITTKKINLLCCAHSVRLVDHFIVSPDEDVYSYNGDGRLDEIKKVADLNYILNEQGEIL